MNLRPFYTSQFANADTRSTGKVAFSVGKFAGREESEPGGENRVLRSASILHVPRFGALCAPGFALSLQHPAGIFRWQATAVVDLLKFGHA